MTEVRYCVLGFGFDKIAFVLVIEMCNFVKLFISETENKDDSSSLFSYLKSKIGRPKTRKTRITPNPVCRGVARQSEDGNL
jgi:hypothetical protein